MLSSKINSHHSIIGKYERDEVLPSIDIACKIADILDVSLDYLTGKADVQIDKVTSERILEVSKFEETGKTISSLLLMPLSLKENSNNFTIKILNEKAVALIANRFQLKQAKSVKGKYRSIASYEKTCNFMCKIRNSYPNLFYH